jgi:hypothetical protein
LVVSTIGGVPVPADPRGGLGFNGEAADLTLQQAVLGNTDVVVQTENLPANTMVYLRIGRARAHAVELGPVLLTSVGFGGVGSVTFTNVDLSAGYSALQARAVLPQP